MTRRHPAEAARSGGSSSAPQAREREQQTLEELKALANASVYAERTRAPAGAAPAPKERLEIGADRLPVAPGANRPTAETKAAAPRKKRHGSSELERVRRHGTGEHIRARRHGTGEYGRARAGAPPGTDTAGRLGPVERAELTPNTAVVLSQLRHELAEKRDQAFGMALERGDAGSADQYLQGRTQGLSEALTLLEKLIASR